MIRIAIQSKGRLSEESLALLAQTPDFPLELLYMRDDDIPQVVAAGTADLGIVGLNEVEERGFPLQVVRKLGFGACRISLAIPKAAEYDGPAWFEGKRIATSYPGILKRYLAEHHINAKVEVITGSVEIAPAAGIADAIFDIVSSGGTLVANVIGGGTIEWRRYSSRKPSWYRPGRLPMKNRPCWTRSCSGWIRPS